LARADERRERLRFDKGSNAVAVGRQRSQDGKGMLLANPHFPWFGGLRFYQMHLTIPGQLDVMGSALPGLPVINIGFNRHLAWTHTVDTSSHFTLYRLQLDPQNPLH
jgi:acyl-homoserine-lactone acylase